MSVRGWVQSAAWRDQGSELTVAASSGATVLMVEDITDFDGDGGTLEINGQRVDYTAVDDDLDTVTLAAGLTAAAAVDDRVAVVTGGQVARDYVAFVDHGPGDPAEVVIPFSDRDLWPEGDYTEPVQVLLSDDLERIEEVPGRTPVRDAVFSTVPAFAGAKGSDSTIPNSTWTFLDGWFTLKGDRVKPDLFTSSWITVEVDGVYDFRVGVTFAAAAGGYRAVRMRYYYPDGSEIGVSRQVRIPGASSEDISVTVVETAQYRTMYAGQSVRFEAWQSSGAPLAMRGSNVFTGPALTDCAVRWVGPA